MASRASAPVEGYYTWRLKETEKLHPPESYHLGNHAESSISGSVLSKAEDDEFADGGLFRSVVKLFMRYEDNRSEEHWAMGTGYLISPDTLITAGHCVHNPDWGAATKIKCFIGYNGRELTDGVQFRFAIKVLTPRNWVASRLRQSDFAVVKVHADFTTEKKGTIIHTFDLLNTPSSFSKDAKVCVVGYPAAGPLIDGSNDPGARMYRHFHRVSKETVFIEKGMLRYAITTGAGQSGAPVIMKYNDVIAREDRFYIIGTHCYGDDGSQTNSGTFIGKEHGRDKEYLLNAITKEDTSTSELPEQCYMKDSNNSGAESSVVAPRPLLEAVGTIVESRRSEDESILKGPIARYLSPICGIVVGGFVKKLNQHRSETWNPQLDMARGTLERAVLAEAVLRMFYHMKNDDTKARMKRLIYVKHEECHLKGDQTSRLAPKMLPVLYHAALLVNLVLGKATIPPERHTTPGNDSELHALPADAKMDAFVRAMESRGPRLHSPTSEAESLPTTVAAFIKRGAGILKPYALSSAREGVAIVDRFLAKLQQPESMPVSGGLGTMTDFKAAELLVSRAIVAECALQAAVDLGVALEPEVILPDDRFFERLPNEVELLRTVVDRVVPAVLKTSMPLVLDAIIGDMGRASTVQTRA